MIGSTSAPDILRVIGASTPLHRVTSHEVAGPCPFCGGRDRFRVNVKTQRWWCRQCNTTEHWSDAYEYLQKREGISFPEAKARLDGVVLPPAPRPAPRPAAEQELGPVVATYDYRDEAGTLLYQKLRHEPKTFSFRRPDQEGGWIKNLTATRRVLYRLPDLLARPQATVFVAEGEKDAESVAGLGLLATADDQGANASFKWSRELAELLRGRHVVILPDKDTVGRARGAAIELALRDLAASILVLELPGEGKDVTDWIAAGGTRAQLEALVREARASEGPWYITNRPAPLLRVDPEWLLAPVLADMVMECTASMEMPVEFFVGPLLATLGAAIGNTRRIRITDDFYDGAAIWSAIVGVPGSGKTPALRRITKPLHAIQKRWRAEFETKNAEYEADLAFWETRRKGDTSLKPAAPTLQRLLASDTTLEALVPILRDTPRGILLERDELYGWILSFNQYKKQGGADREAWLSIWNNTSFSVDRKGGNFSVYVEHPYVCVAGGIQPDKLRALLSGLEDGFTDRLLLFWPQAAPLKLNQSTTSREMTDRYAAHIEALAALPVPLGEDGMPAPISIGLDPAAYRFFEGRFNALAQLSYDPDTPAALAQAYGKLSNQAARIALILHTCQALDIPGAVDPLRVNLETMTCAWRIVDAAASNLSRVHGDLALSPRDIRCKKAVEWIGRHGRRATVRDLVRANVAGVKSASSALDLINEMADRHLGAKTVEVAGGAERVAFALPQEAS